MTCIAFDGVTLAADRKVDGRYNARKIIKLKKGGYLAAAGYLDDLIEVARWIDRGMKDADNPFGKLNGAKDGSHYLLVNEKGVPFMFTSPWLRPFRVTEKLIALGSGGDLALGAMAAGAPARKAVSIACRFDPDCGMGIDVVRVKP